jgi:hypothetical protein
MRFLSRFALVVTVCTAWSVSYGQNVVGNWTGHIDVSAAKGKDAKEQKMIDSMKGMFAKMIIKLNFKADKTYAVTTSGMGPKAQTETGKWSQSGKTVTVYDKKGKAEKMVLSGNTLVMTPPTGNSGPKGMKIVFSRG